MLWGLFWVYLPTKNFKQSFYILLKSLDITVVVSKLKNMFGLPLLWIFWGVFVYYMRLKLCNLKHHQYSQHPIMWVLFSVITNMK